MHSTESRVAICPSNMLFAGMSVCTFQPGKLTSWCSYGVNLGQDEKGPPSSSSGTVPEATTGKVFSNGFEGVQDFLSA